MFTGTLNQLHLKSSYCSFTSSHTISLFLLIHLIHISLGARNFSYCSTTSTISLEKLINVRFVIPVTLLVVIISFALCFLYFKLIPFVTPKFCSSVQHIIYDLRLHHHYGQRITLHFSPSNNISNFLDQRHKSFF